MDTTNNPYSELVGEQVAKAVRERAAALESLRSTRVAPRGWRIWPCALGAAISLALIAESAVTRGVIAMALIAGAALGVALVAVAQCANLQKRLDAALVVLMQQSGEG